MCASACVCIARCELFSSKKRLARLLESIVLYMKRHISVSCHQPLNRTTSGGGPDIHLAELELSSHCLAFCSSCCYFIFQLRVSLSACVCILALHFRICEMKLNELIKSDSHSQIILLIYLSHGICQAAPQRFSHSSRVSECPLDGAIVLFS